MEKHTFVDCQGLVPSERNIAPRFPEKGRQVMPLDKGTTLVLADLEGSPNEFGKGGQRTEMIMTRLRVNRSIIHSTDTLLETLNIAIMMLAVVRL